MRLNERIERHLKQGVLLAGGLAIAGPAAAAIVHSGVVNVPIPLNFDGVYLNVVTGATGSSGGSVAGWDINPYNTSGLSWFVPSVPAGSHGLVRGAGTSTSQVDNLGGAGFYLTYSIDGAATQSFGTGSNQTVGATAFTFNSTANIVGFRFLNEATGQVNYGWMRLSLSAGFNTDRSIVEWAYENTGAPIVAGALPPADADGDGVPDGSDNCPAVANPSQADCDSDGVGDTCETDPDINLNGIPDACEAGGLVFSVPDDFPTIGSAITAAPNGSIVRVAPGSYAERINFGGKAITVESSGGAATTALDGGGLPGSIVTFISFEGPSSVLRGFTIRNGQGGSPLPQSPQEYTVGGGIHINRASPTIEDCIIENCSAPFGGGVVVYRSSSILRNCTFEGNVASGAGGALFLFRGYGALVEGCTFTGNEAGIGGAIMGSYGWSTIRDCELVANSADWQGSAIRWQYIGNEPDEPPFMTIEGCVITKNASSIFGCAAVSALPNPATMSIEDSQICGNADRDTQGAYLDLGGNEICDCLADVNQDGIVNSGDLSAVLAAWGPCPGWCPADIDGSGTVDGNDITYVMAAWGATGPCP